MKRLFFAPFLLASLFSFGVELKANPRYSNSTPTPTASAERWYMVTIATNQRKTFQGYSPCPLRSYWSWMNGNKVKERIKNKYVEYNIIIILTLAIGLILNRLPFNQAILLLSH